LLSYFRIFPKRRNIKIWNLYDGPIKPYSEQVFDTQTILYGGILKRWDGSNWVKAKLKVFDGTNFIQTNKLYVYKAGSFQLVDCTGV